MGIRLTLEIVNRYESNLINTVAQALELVRMRGSDNISLHLDTFINIAKRGDPPKRAVVVRSHALSSSPARESETRDSHAEQCQRRGLRNTERRSLSASGHRALIETIRSQRPPLRIPTRSTALPQSREECRR
jgi:hypothetical protein